MSNVIYYQDVLDNVNSSMSDYEARSEFPPDRMLEQCELLYKWGVNELMQNGISEAWDINS